MLHKYFGEHTPAICSTYTLTVQAHSIQYKTVALHRVYSTHNHNYSSTKCRLTASTQQSGIYTHSTVTRVQYEIVVLQYVHSTYTVLYSMYITRSEMDPGKRIQNTSLLFILHLRGSYTFNSKIILNLFY